MELQKRKLCGPDFWYDYITFFKQKSSRDILSNYKLFQRILCYVAYFFY